MCRLFIGAHPDGWQSQARSMRLSGSVTSIRLENYFWHVLEDIAHRDGLSLSKLIARLHHESLEAGHDIRNFTSFLRVCCLRYLNLQLSGVIPIDSSVAIASLDADSILQQEQNAMH